MRILVPTGNYFFNFQHFFFLFFLSKLLVLFLQKKKREKDKKKKKYFAFAQVAIISATRWTGNKLFLRVAQKYVIFLNMHFCDKLTN